MAILVVVKKAHQSKASKAEQKLEPPTDNLHHVNTTSEAKERLKQDQYDLMVICGVFIPEFHPTQYDNIPRGLSLAEICKQQSIPVTICSEFSGEGSSMLKTWAQYHAKVVAILWKSTFQECIKQK